MKGYLLFVLNINIFTICNLGFELDIQRIMHY